MRTKQLLPFLFLILSGCTAIPPVLEPAPVIHPTITPLPTSEIITTSPPETTLLTIWVTPRFQADPATEAGELLQIHLDEFEALNPNISIQIRVKETQGSGGMLTTLAAASAAAPEALPDLAILNPVDFHSAASKGLLQNLEGLRETPSTPDWYDFAAEAAKIDGIFYGLPFASNADILVYQTSVYTSPPLAWSDYLSSPDPFTFPAGDPAAIFTMAQFLDLQGELYDSEGNAVLDPTVLAEVLTFYASARTAGALTLTSLQTQALSESWSQVQQHAVAAGAATLEAFLLENADPTLAAIPLPTRDGSGISMTQSWAWTILTPEPGKQIIAAELLDWLMQPDFSGSWTYALGLLPSNPDALAVWPDSPNSSLANLIVQTAVHRPGTETTAIFGPLFNQATSDVLNNISSPEEAAQSAATAIRQP
jgi:ABC-type glycerol-3-phosphate transport system substrate-binding protein